MSLRRHAYTILLTTIVAGIGPSASFAQQPARQDKRETVESYLKTISEQSPISGGLLGVVAVNSSGDTLASWNPHTRLIPASNTKLITCGAAMHALGADYRFATELAYSGEISGGTLHGDLYIIGGGDPTLGAVGTAAIAQDVTFATWKRLLTQAGIRRIEGRIIGDSRAIPNDGGCADWTKEDVAFYYGSAVEGLNFYKNKIDLTAEPGQSVGDPVSVTERWPHAPWMIYSHHALTGPAGTGDKLSYANSSFGPFGALGGTLAIDKGRRLEECANPYGAWTCAAHFHKFLVENGIKVLGPWADIATDGSIREDLMASLGGEVATPKESLHILGKSWSSALRNIVKETLWESDNFYAEALLRAIGLENGPGTSLDSCLVAEKAVLRQMGADPSGIQLRDGSGLARTNYITPEYLVRFLGVMRALPEGETFIATLPSAGQGTLAISLTKQSMLLKSRVRMKSGSMNGVRCYSGYILPDPASPQGETVIFSIMTNNVTARQSAVSPLLDRIIYLLSL